MLLDHIRRMFDYHYWGTALILDTAEKLSQEEFEQDTRFPINSLKETLLHTLNAERIYRMRLAGEEPSSLDAASFADLAALRAQWDQEEEQMRGYLASLDEAAVGEAFSYTVASTGKEYERLRSDILTQLLFHGMQHRAEMAQMLTEFGHSPGNIDYLVYINQG